MKVITVNIPVAWVQKIKGLIGDSGLYPSRCELIRVALRDFLIKEMRNLKIMSSPIREIIEKNKEIDDNDENIVKIPVQTIIVGDTTVTEYKKYRVIGKNGVKFNETL